MNFAILAKFQKISLSFCQVMDNQLIDATQGIVVVTVTLRSIGTTRRVPMILDTGASYTLISWEIAQALNLKPELQQRQTEIVTASGREIVPVVMVNKVELLGRSRSNISAVVHDLPKNAYASGLLGLSFLRYFNFCLRFKDRKLVFED